MCVNITILDDNAAEPDENFTINWIAPNASNVIITPAVTIVTIESKYTLFMYMDVYMTCTCTCTCIVNNIFIL